jgi:hypothetical protein
MTPDPIRIPNATTHFAVWGRLYSGFRLLVVSDDCPLALLNAMPNNPSGELSGRLECEWSNIFKPSYNWAYSGSLPDLGPSQVAPPPSMPESGSEVGAYSIGFQPGSRLQLAWRGYSTMRVRSRVQKQLDLQKVDLCEAIIAGDKNAVSNSLGPILLECEGYSTGIGALG